MAQTALALIGYGLDLAIAKAIEKQGMRMPDIKALADDGFQELGIPPYVMKAIRDSIRTPIPSNTVMQVLNDSAFACCICKDRQRSVVIHHIRKFSESRDHSEGNLVAICVQHHDVAHTHSELSQNLTPARLLAFKKAWLEEIQAQKNVTLSTSHSNRPPNEHYIPFVIDGDLCPGCHKGILRWYRWGHSPFGSFSAWFMCSECGDVVASQEQFGS